MFIDLFSIVQQNVLVFKRIQIILNVGFIFTLIFTLLVVYKFVFFLFFLHTCSALLLHLNQGPDYHYFIADFSRWNLEVSEQSSTSVQIVGYYPLPLFFQWYKASKMTSIISCLYLLFICYCFLGFWWQMYPIECTDRMSLKWKIRRDCKFSHVNFTSSSIAFLITNLLAHQSSVIRTLAAFSDCIFLEADGFWQQCHFHSQSLQWLAVLPNSFRLHLFLWNCLFAALNQFIKKDSNQLEKIIFLPFCFRQHVALLPHIKRRDTTLVQPESL